MELSKQEIANKLGCTVAQLNAQYKANALGLLKMKQKAVATNKKVGGFTSEQLNEMYYKFKELAK